MYVRLPASEAQTDYTNLIDIDGGFKMTRGLEFSAAGGDPPKIRTNANAILVPVFPSQKGSSLVRATGTHEFVFMPPPAAESLRPLFFALGATHTLRLQDGEMIEWNGITRRASGTVEVQFSIDPGGKLKSAVKKGKLAQL
jgi:hypothetical protein